MPPRIVLDGRLLHYNRTGIGRYIRHLYTALAALDEPPQRPAITVLYHRKDSERALRRCWDSATAWTPAHHRLERWALAAEVLARRPALLHAPDHVCPQPLGWRTVVTVHDLAFWRFPETHTADSRAYYYGLRRSVAQADRVICVSEATRRDLLDLTGVDPAKLRVVHEAPGPAYLADAATEGRGRSAPTTAAATAGAPADAAGGRPYFVAVGTIEPRKNVAAIVSALAGLRGPRPALLVVGADGAGAAEVRSLPARLGVEDDVRFLGRLPTAQVAALYRGALALVYPSLLEGFGLPILEAMASGAPVVTANRSATAEVAGDAALLVDPEDVAALTQAMARLADDGALRDRLRARGRARASQFSWQRAARETLSVFGEALGA